MMNIGKNLWEISQMNVGTYWGGIADLLEYHAPTRKAVFKIAIDEYVGRRIASGIPTKKPISIIVRKVKLSKYSYPTDK
jgi:hypothetical protein